MKLSTLKIQTIIVLLLVLISCCTEIKDDTKFKMPSNVINKILIDKAGVKWIATAKGLVSYDGVKWTAYTQGLNFSDVSINDLALENNSVQDTLWMGTVIGATSFVGNKNVLSSIINYTTEKCNILDNNILALEVSANDVKYIGTTKGISILKDNKWTNFSGKTPDTFLSKFNISSIASANDGNVYAATLGGGVSRFKYADAVSGATKFDVDWSGLESDTVNTVFVDQDSHQWYGTTKGLAYHSSPNTKSDWTSYSRADGLICDTVYAINKDNTGKIWVGTHRGISVLNGEQWQNITTKEGLVDNRVKTIAVDLDGSIWIGTNNGISHYTNGIWKNFQ